MLKEIEEFEYLGADLLVIKGKIDFIGRSIENTGHILDEEFLSDDWRVQGLVNILYECAFKIEAVVKRLYPEEFKEPMTEKAGGADHEN